MLKYNRIYVYTTTELKDKIWVGSREGKGYLKIGQTRDISAESRVKQQFQGSPAILKNNEFEILLDEEAITSEGTYFTDTKIHKFLTISGVYRVPNTEWFECTLEEVKEAISFLKEGKSLRNIALSSKNTVERRGSSYNKKEATTERSKLKRPENILQIISTYPDANSNVSIAKYLIEKYNIKQYSATTVSVIIGDVVKGLISKGVIENKGTQFKPDLHVVTSTYTEPKQIRKPKLTKEELLPFIIENMVL